jgi:flagellar hook-basal body complex protein FliE
MTSPIPAGRLLAGAVPPVAVPRPPVITPGLDSPSFGDLLGSAVGDVSRQQDASRDAMSAMLRGDPVEMHEVMATAEEATLSLELMVEIRNKLAEAYRSIMNMQV